MLNFVIVLTIAMRFSLHSQQKYEPGIALIKVKNPLTVSMNRNVVINGSEKLQGTLNRFSVPNSKKLSHVDLETDGCYRLEFPSAVDVEAIRDSLRACPFCTILCEGNLAPKRNHPSL